MKSKSTEQQLQKEKTTELADLRQLNESLAVNTAWLRSTLEAIGEAIFSFDQDGSILTCNRAATKMFGYSAEELLGSDVSILLPPPDESGSHLYLDGYFRNNLIPNPNSRREGIGRRRDGRFFPFNSTINKMSFEEEIIFIAIFSDISLIKSLERDNRQAHHEIRQILDSAADGMRIISEDFIVLRANATFCTLAGSTMDKIVGHKCYESFPGAVCDTSLCPVRQMFNGVQHIEYEVEKVRVDGASVPCLLSANPYFDETGKQVGIIEDFRDISKIKETERSLLELSEKAAMASHAKGLFIANMSHELRTPLNSIRGMAYLLEKNPLTPEQKQQTLRLSQAIQSLLGMVDTILDFSSLDREEMLLAREEFHLETLLEDLESQFSERCRQKGLLFTISLAKNIPLSLVGDNQRLQQVLSLLIDNGIKFTNQGNISLSITLDTGDEEEVLLSFAVKDTGVGMSPEAQMLALEPFTQLDGSATRSQGGVGLGLSLAAKLLTLTNSELLIDSQPGRGSLFSFSIVFGRGAGTANKANKKKTDILPLETREESRDLIKPVKADQESEQILSLFRKLASSLQAADIQSKELVSALLDCPHTSETHTELLLLEKAVTGYDFELAENILTTIVRKSEFPLTD